MVVVQTASTGSQVPGRYPASLLRPKVVHLSAGTGALWEMSEPSNLTQSYQIRTGIRETKLVRFSQSVFQISPLYLLPPKASISPSSKGKQKKRQREYNSHRASSPASIMSRLLGNQPQPGYSNRQAEEWMSDLQVTPHVLFRAGVSSCCSTKLAENSQKEPAVLEALPLGFCLSHTGQRPLTFAFNEDKLWLFPQKQI